MARLLSLSSAFAVSALLAGCMTTGAEAPVVVNQVNDHAMTCPQIVAEINQMNTKLGIEQGEMRNAEALNIAQDLAVNAALYSGALSSAATSVPFLGSIVGAAGQVNQANQEQAKAAADAATNRRNVLTGMHAAKGCATASAQSGTGNQG